MSYLERPSLIHVAAESENRGRVVLAARTGTPHPTAITAALSVARAFETWVECLLVACPDVLALTEHSFARQISHAGRIAPLASESVVDGQDLGLGQARREIMMAAERAGVRLTTTTVRDGCVAALAKACVMQGPWNIVALADAIQPNDGRWLPEVFDGVAGATGLVCTGAQAAPKSAGPVIVIVEDSARVPHMLRVAERLAHPWPGKVAQTIMLLLAGRTRDETVELETHVRLLLPAGVTDRGVAADIADAGVLHGTPAEIAEAVRRLDGGWIIAQAGGAAVPATGEIAALLSVLRCPLLLVR